MDVTSSSTHEQYLPRYLQRAKRGTKWGHWFRTRKYFIIHDITMYISCRRLFLLSLYYSIRILTYHLLYMRTYARTHTWSFQHSYPASQGLAEPQTEKGKGQDFISLSLFLLRHWPGERKLNMVNPCSFFPSPLPNQLEQEDWRGPEDTEISRDERMMICQGVGCEQSYGSHHNWVSEKIGTRMFSKWLNSRSIFEECLDWKRKLQCAAMFRMQVQC